MKKWIILLCILSLLLGLAACGGKEDSYPIEAEGQEGSQDTEDHQEEPAPPAGLETEGEEPVLPDTPSQDKEEA